MPFTTSHPAIVLPLKQLWPRYISLSGLIAGAMSPDLLYFLMMGTTERSFSHSWPGLLLFCLPAGIAFVFAFHWLVKRPLLRSLPEPLDHHFSGLAAQRFRVRSGRAWAVLVVSVLVGALSHFFWDSWTHTGGVIARNIPFLLEWVHFGNYWIQVTMLIQHASSLFGALFIVLYLWKGWILPAPVKGGTPVGRYQKAGYWAVALTGAIIGAFVAVWIWVGFPSIEIFDEYTRLSLKCAGLGSWAGFFWTTCLYSLASRRTPTLQAGPAKQRELVS